MNTTIPSGSRLVTLIAAATFSLAVAACTDSAQNQDDTGTTTPPPSGTSTTPGTGTATTSPTTP